MKKAFIIGGNTGIGKALKTELENKGFYVISESSSSENPVNIQDETPNFPEIEDELHTLVYCPGSINLKPFQSLKLKDFQQDLEVNYLGLVKTVMHYLPLLKKGNGSVVAFSTVAVQTGMAYHASIGGAKGALEGLIRSLAAEFAPSIRFNAIAPSVTDTPLAVRLLRSEKQQEAAANRHPMKRIGAPEDIAKIAAFLASEESSWVTGQVWSVDGGMSAIRTF